MSIIGIKRLLINIYENTLSVKNTLLNVFNNEKYQKTLQKL